MARPSKTGGKTSKAKASNARPAKGRKTTKTKRRIAPAPIRVKRHSVSGLSKDLKDARAQQAATAEILKVIASSPSDVQPVFVAIAASANRLLGGFSTAVSRFIDGMVHLAAFTPVNPTADAVLRSTFPAPTAVLPAFVLAARGEPAQIADTEALADERLLEISRARGYRSVLFVPLMNGGLPIGMISVARVAPGTFSPHHVQLLQTFADQAVIAIQNVRLFNEVQAKTRDLSEALTYQTGSANILKVIASSPTDINPVFQAIVESACELCDAYDAVLRLKSGDNLCFSAHHGPISTFTHERPINRDWSAGRAVIDQKPIQIADLLSPEGNEFPEAREIALQQKHRTVLSVPLLREGECLGAITLRRKEVHPFSDKQITLLQTFADQAVIAIGNVRLFEEVQAKTRDLSEALTYQTGSSNILRVIASSPIDVKPVLQAIVESACELCGAYDAIVRLKDGDGLAFGAHHGPLPVSFERVPISAGSMGGLAMTERRPVHVHDIQSPEGDALPFTRELARRYDTRTLLVVPLMRENESIGAILLRRAEVNPFTEKQIALLQTFADQAVIAIENARLFNETKEALEQQTATSEVLEVISASTGELQPVFQKMLENATRICEAKFAQLFLYDEEDNLFRGVGRWNLPPAWGEFLEKNQFRVDPMTPLGRVAMTKQPVQVLDVLADQAYVDRRPGMVAVAELGGARTLLQVPMLKENELVGAFGIFRQEVRPFTDKQIALVQNFAAQAVIAIENARLLNELRQRTADLSESLQQQTATSEVLKVISSSPGELEPVFRSMLENAVSICDAKFGNLFLVDGDTARWEAGVGTPPKLAEYFTQSESFRPTSGSHLDRVMRTKQVSHTDDDTAEAVVGAAARLGRARSTVCVPMVKDDELVGTIFIYRTEVRPFTDKQIDLVKNFAAQAVIAIENARLLKELRQRTDDLSKSLDDLRTAQDRLVQTEKLASLGQLTAGIAHEIKNPLNFVNNFSALSAELTDELNDVLKPVTLDGKVREEVDELTGMLRSNLEKVVQHGKRADSIVKNMLLHSREGSKEHRPADINSLLDESLNLAYHGARAEKGEFNITLQRDFDADAGTIEVFPQEITRAFLNLIANGVYATTRRKTENKEPGFEPTLRATTKNLGTTVEIRIRDNGSGIPAEVQEKMFNPFFTTKPAGEGTGLGLSMTHDIIVKQHGGRIDVATEPGQFTEFTIVLPRKTNLSGTERGKP